jgi:hypothetical protein
MEVVVPSELSMYYQTPRSITVNKGFRNPGFCCSLTLRAEHRLGVFENRVLKRIFGPQRDEVTGEWRKLHNEELRDLYSSPSIIRILMSKENEIGRACSTN